MRTPTQNSPSPSPSRPAAITATTPFLTPSKSSEPRFNGPSRYFLTLQARVWRFLARIGFWLHTFPKPSPPAPSFLRSFTPTALHNDNGATTTTDPAATSLTLAFYVPADYARQIRRGKRYPLVLNFHGGGFTVGRPTDDARWAAALVRTLDTVVVCAAYRLAPEFPFPTAVEDAVCALLYLSEHADALGIDRGKVSLTGFSAGGNLAFTVLLRLQTYLRSLEEEDEQGEEDRVIARRGLPRQQQLPTIVAIIAWYPSLDYRLSRPDRRAKNPRPDKNLPLLLTTLFDHSYLPDPTSVTSPYVSPAAASDEALMTALPGHVALFLCEWDMLVGEGRAFAERLERLGKKVRCVVVGGRAHAFDKSAWPFGLDGKVGWCYGEACGWLGEVLEEVRGKG